MLKNIDSFIANYFKNMSIKSKYLMKILLDISPILNEVI